MKQFNGCNRFWAFQKRPDIARNERSGLWFAVMIGMLFCQTDLQAQLTIRVNSVPANTPTGAALYLTGSFNNWNTADASMAMLSIGGGKYSITIYPAPGTVQFKVTRGSWASAEGTATGSFLSNRTVTYSGQPKTIEISILTWVDAGGSNPGIAGPIVTPGVQMMDDDFFIPQLNRTRRVWMYIPPDYNSNPGKRYPVIYMQDGQNLFQDPVGPAGNWKVDETLNQLFSQGDRGCIVIGVESSSVNRTDEYSNWMNPQYGGGEAAQYLDFIVNTLKPYIDAHYRTLSTREYTAVGGSSLGGLFALYAAIERQDVFSKAAIFSPSIWFAGSKILNYIMNHPKMEDDVRLFFLAGQQEPPYIQSDVTAAVDELTAAGYDAQDLHTEIMADGTHTETFWRREFGKAYQWLFKGQQSVSGVLDFGVPEVLPLSVYPNPTTDWVRFKSLNTATTMQVQIVGVDGRIWRETKMASSDAIPTYDLPNGHYFVRALLNDEHQWRVAPLAKR
jgi:predicted alpha/beta superfamily hydrolase